MTTVLLNTIHEKTKEALKWSKESQRLAWHTDSFPKSNWELVTCFEDDTKLAYSEKEYCVRMGNQVFPFVRHKCGFGLDKKTKKITMWWGSSVMKLMKVRLLLKAKGIDWIDNSLFPYITPTILGKLLLNGITNEEQLLKKILSVQRIKMSPDTFMRLIAHFEKFQISTINKAFYNLDNAEVSDLYSKSKTVLAMSERLDYEDKDKYEETANALKMIRALDGELERQEALLW